MANACACGCGELLPENSTRQYKRGHKNRPWETPVTGYAETPDVNDETTGEFTLEDAIRDTPDDAPPKVQTESDKPKPTVRITASVRKDIEGKLAFVFGMSGEIWGMVDPVCGMALSEHGATMAKQYTPIVCQSPQMVRALTKGGNFVLWVNAFMATLPVLQIIFAHHIAKTIGVMEMTPSGQSRNPEMYTVS